MLQGLLLGGEERTDVFEVQIANPSTGAWLTDEGTALSIAVALRQALTENLGIDPREVGWSLGTAENTNRCSIHLFDSTSGGAGYVAVAARELPGLLARAREVLECPNDCDKACHACLLAFDTRDVAEGLDRKEALEFLNDAFLATLSLPEKLRVFGDETVYETALLPSTLVARARRGDARFLRLFLSGDGPSWDLQRSGNSAAQGPGSQSVPGDRRSVFRGT